jgi:hypothetical protein
MILRESREESRTDTDSPVGGESRAGESLDFARVLLSAREGGGGCCDTSAPVAQTFPQFAGSQHEHSRHKG